MASRLHLSQNVNHYVFVLQIASLWVSENEPIFYIFYKFLISAITTFYCGCQIFYLFFSTQEFQQLIASLTFLPLFVSSILKMYIFRYKFNCVKEMIIIFKNEYFEPKNEEQAKILTEALRLSRRIFVLFISFCVAAILLLAVSSFINEEPSVLFKAWFPLYTMLEDKYGLVFTYQLISLFYMAWNQVAADSFFAISMLQIGAQFKMLCNSARNIVPRYIPETEVHQQIRSINATLIACVKHHEQIIKLSRLNLEAFNVILINQFLSSTYVFCLMAVFMSMAVPSDPQYLILTICSTAAIAEIGLYCWFGNEVTVESGNLFYNIFQSRWYQCSSQLKKSLLIFMMNTQKPITLHVVNVIPINIATLLSISRSAYAYFTAFKQVINK